MMNGLPVTFVCHWGGNVLHNSDGCRYDILPKGVIIARSRWNYSMLVDELYKVTGVDLRGFKLGVICRFPCSFDCGIGNYVALPIEDDGGVEAMFNATARYVGIGSLMLFLDIVPVDTGHEAEFVSGEDSMQIEDGHGIGEVPSNMCNEDVEIDCENDELDSRLEDDEYKDYNSDCNIDESSEMDENLFPCESSKSRMHVGADYLFFRDIGQGSYATPNREFSFPVWDEEHEPIVTGLRFPTKMEMEYAIKRHHIFNNWHYKVKTSTNLIWIIVCVMKEYPCKFYLRASLKKKHNLWEVTRYKGPHSCLCSGVGQDHPHLDAKLIAWEVLDLVEKDVEVKVEVIIKDIKKKYAKTVSFKKAWCGKQKAIAQVYGDWEKSYERMPRILAAIKQYNPETVVEFYNPPPAGEISVFDGVFWAFEPCLEAFSHCRPVISVDRTFFRGRYRGVILIAMGIDADDRPFPLAFAIVKTEDFRNWQWFLKLVNKHVVKCREVCLISNHHQGILKTIVSETGWQNVHHRYCLRHMQANFMEKHKGSELKRLFWVAGYSHQDRKLKNALEQIQSLDKQAFTWFEGLDAKKWTLAHDGGYRYGIMTTGISEIFNEVMKGSRSMPIACVVKTSFYRCVEYFVNRRGIGNDIQHGFNHKINLQMQNNMKKAGNHEVSAVNSSEAGVYSVTTGRHGSKGGNVQTVHMGEGTCTCGKWVAYHVPCSHVIACCKSQHIQHTNFISSYYNMESYYKTWSGTFEPLEHEAYWNVGKVPLFTPDPTLRRARKGGQA